MVMNDEIRRQLEAAAEQLPFNLREKCLRELATINDEDEARGMIWSYIEMDLREW